MIIPQLSQGGGGWGWLRAHAKVKNTQPGGIGRRVAGGKEEFVRFHQEPFAADRGVRANVCPALPLLSLRRGQ